MTVYYGTLSEAGKNPLFQIQYRAAKVVSGVLHLWSVFLDMGWETLQERHDFLGFTIFNKIQNNLTIPFVIQCMPITNTNTQYQLRSSPPYRQFKYHNKKFNDSFFPKVFLAWNLQSDVKEIKMILRSALGHLLNQSVTNYFLSVQNLAAPWQPS